MDACCLVLRVYTSKMNKVINVENNGYYQTWGRSSVGRAPALHAGGQEFKSPRLHHVVH